LLIVGLAGGYLTYDRFSAQPAQRASAPAESTSATGGVPASANLKAQTQHLQQIADTLAADQLAANPLNFADESSLPPANRGNSTSELHQYLDKHPFGGNMQQGQTVFSADKVNIPGRLLKQVQDLDPATEPGWEKKIGRIFKELPNDERKYVYSQYLEPKGIRYQAEKRRFVYQKPQQFSEVVAGLHNPELKMIGNKLTRLLAKMSETREAIQFADQIEAAVDLVSQFDPREELSIQKEKNQLRKALLSELAYVTQNAVFEIEPNPRALRAPAIKRFIIDIYIKHQMLGYRFRTLPIGTLEKDPDPYIQQAVAPEARLRQCEIIKTDSLIYLLAPAKDATTNPYSIRRFLNEETLLGGQFIYFNGIIINYNERLKEEKYRRGIAKILKRIVTLERQLSGSIVELVRQLDQFQENRLLPMVGSKVSSDGSSLGFALENRMNEFDALVEKEILKRIESAITTKASTHDDYEYLFFSLRRLLIDLAGGVEDLASATAWNTRVERSQLKLLALLHLMDKRKNDIFSARDADDIEVENDPKLLVKELNGYLKKYNHELIALDRRLRDAIDEENQPSKGFMSVVKTKLGMNKRKESAEDIRATIYNIRHKCFLELVRTLKKYPKVRVSMEYEEVTAVVDGIRNYAIAQGIRGISQLPVIVRLQEDAAAFDIGDIMRALTPRPEMEDA